MDVNTPWTHLAEHKDLKVVMLVSEDPNASREVFLAAFGKAAASD